jgi:exonuclease SbcD
LSGPVVKILHTSDWHLGRGLARIRRRHEEHEKFLSWLVELISQEKIDALLVAGDIFDNAAPAVSAQELYYNFLVQVMKTSCHNLVIIAGNHDSAAFLSAPARLLKFFHIHVIGDPGEPTSEVLTLTDPAGQPELLVAAVPFLRDRFVRLSQEGESSQDKTQSLINGLKAHYAAVTEVAVARRAQLGQPVPLVGMGHLFAAGGLVTEGDGVRDLYAGSLAQVPADSFSEEFDYLALGHLHRPQTVGRETIRYSGSPFQMSFAESGEKSVGLISLGQGQLTVRLAPIPVFQELKRLKGDKIQLLQQIRDLKKAGSQAWLEVIHTGSEILGDARSLFEEALKGGAMELAAVIDERINQEIFANLGGGKSLGEMSPQEVFDQLLENKKVPEPERPELRATFAELVQAFNEAGQTDQ